MPVLSSSDGYRRNARRQYLWYTYRIQVVTTEETSMQWPNQSDDIIWNCRNDQPSSAITQSSDSPGHTHECANFLLGIGEGDGGRMPSLRKLPHMIQAGHQYGTDHEWLIQWLRIPIGCIGRYAWWNLAIPFPIGCIGWYAWLFCNMNLVLLSFCSVFN